VLALVAACAAPPPPPPPTTVTLKLTAAADANATASGAGAPVAIRVYQLAATPGFEAAEFFRLYNTDAAVLGADLVKKDEVLLAPGESRTLTLAPLDTVHAIGVFAAYRDFAHVAWRATAAVPAHQATTLAVTAGRGGIGVAPASGP
jgi:type VI secretion system protein VasD